MERRLLAILAADVVGYSRLMHDDEVDTFERVRQLWRDLFEPEIQRHHGRIFKLMGDGLLAEFASVIDAATCAMTLQRRLAETTPETPERTAIAMRMGINLVDVILMGDDRHGDGVNVAARLQHLDEPEASA